MGKVMLGKWVMVDGGEYYQVGEVCSVLEGFILVRLRPFVGPPGGHKLFSLFELTEDLTMFFDSEKELDEYIEWAESGPSPHLKIVPLGKKDP